MPKVQVYDRPTVALRGVGDNQINVQAPDAAPIGRAIAGVGQVLADNAIKMQQEDNAQAAIEAYTNANDELRPVLYDENSGVYSQRGKNALNGMDTATKSIDDIHKKYKKSLANDAQRDAFTELWGRKRTSSLDGVARHVAGQRRIYKDENAKAILTGSIEDAANGFNDPEAVRGAIDTAKLVIRTNYKGASEEVVKQKTEAAVSAIHKAVIDRMMIDDPAGASAYYKKNIKEVDGKDHKDIESRLKTRGVRAAALDAAEQITAQGGTFQERLDAANKIKDDETRSETRKVLSSEYSQNKVAEAARKEQVTNDFWSDFIKDPNQQKLTDALTNSDLSAADKKQAAKWLKGDKQETNWDVYDQLEGMIEAGDIKQASQLDRYQAYLKDRDYRALRKMWDKRGVIPYTQVKRAFTERIGKSYAKWTNDQKEEFIAFQEYVAERVKEVRRPEDIGSWADAWFLEGRDSERSFAERYVPFVSTPSTLGRAITEGRGAKFDVEIPDEDADLVNSAMAASGIEGNKSTYYRKYYRPAVDYLKAHELTTNADYIAATSALMASDKPVVPANIDAVAKQIQSNRTEK